MAPVNRRGGKNLQGGNLVENYALVRWLTGMYAGTYTHNVSTSWILNFDPDSEESQLVEWRKPPMPKTGSWPVYDCEVLEVSGTCNSFST